MGTFGSVGSIDVNFSRDCPSAGAGRCPLKFSSSSIGRCAVLKHCKALERRLHTSLRCSSAPSEDSTMCLMVYIAAHKALRKVDWVEAAPAFYVADFVA